MLQPPAAQFARPASQRHYGMDWLRIGAFALLILYHIGMVFAPWGWVVKAQVTHAWLIPPMAAVTPWRLALLFAVSGYASAKLLAREAGPGAFLRGRSSRLLVPLAFGMAVLVPLEMWVRVREAGYSTGYLGFWAGDYWRWGEFWGSEFPSWEHLWFVAYLWVYTLLLAGLVSAVGDAWVARIVDWCRPRWRLLWAPAAALVTAKLLLMFVVAERQGVFTDWGGHAEYFPLFLFGFAAARDERVWPMLARIWRWALLMAASAGAIVVAVELAFPAEAIPPHGLAALDRAARVTMAWGMTVTLFHLANRHLNRDHRWRRPLAAAVFPAYLVHHPVIVLVAWWAVEHRWPAAAEFAVLLGASLAASALTYLAARRFPVFGRLVGVAPAARDAPAPALVR